VRASPTYLYISSWFKYLEFSYAYTPACFPYVCKVTEQYRTDIGEKARGENAFEVQDAIEVQITLL
jgi:hypothetical protein